MKRFKTLRMRFALWTAGLFLIILTVFGIYIYLSLARSLSLALDEFLALNASQVIAGLDVENGHLVLPDSLLEPPDADLPVGDLSVRILSPDGQILQQAGQYASRLELPAQLQSTPIYTMLDTLHLRVYTTPITDNDQTVAIIQVAQSLDDIQDTLQRLRNILLLSIPLLVFATGASGYFLAAYALRPVGEMARTARRISAQDLSARIALPGEDELGRLSITFDEMLARLEDAFTRQRRFSADASHELRTPLTAMGAIISVTRQRRRAPEEYENALDDLAEETGRMQILTENLLALSRADLQLVAHSETIQLTDLLLDVVDSMCPLAEVKGLSFFSTIASGLTLTGDRDGLIRLFINLLDNAIKYTERGEIRLTVDRRKNNIHVEVSDTGIGISAEHLPHIFDRFYRANPSRSAGGAGLGLSFVQEIVRAHHGTIQVNSTPGQGSSFKIEFPLS